MAKLRYGSVITDARGSIEGITLTKGRFGAVAKARANPTRKLTALNTNYQAGLATVTKRWGSALTQAQRDGWKALAAANPITDVYGNLHALTGLQMFTRVNQVRRAVGLSILDASPADQTATALVTIAVAVTTAPLVSIAFTATPLSVGHRLYIFATQPLSPGRDSVESELRFIGVSGLAVASPFNATTLYTTRFGNPISGRASSFHVFTERDDRGVVMAGLFAKINVV